MLALLATLALAFDPVWGAAWDDLQVSASTTSRLGTTDPDWVALSAGVYALAFDGAGIRNEEVMFQAQMPHTWREGSTIYPHVHWAPSTNDAGNVRWCLEIAIANKNETLTAAAADCVDMTSSGVAFRHQWDNLTPITMSGKTISAMLVGRLYRNGSSANDTYDGKDAFLLEVDFHYELDRPGSNTITGK
jgi:hypothetical protein